MTSHQIPYTRLHKYIQVTTKKVSTTRSLDFHQPDIFMISYYKRRRSSTPTREPEGNGRQPPSFNPRIVTRAHVSASGASTFHDHAFACVANAICQWSPRGVLLPPETMSKSVAPLAPSSRSYCLPLETKESESCAAAPTCLSTRTQSVA